MLSPIVLSVALIERGEDQLAGDLVALRPRVRPGVRAEASGRTRHPGGGQQATWRAARPGRREGAPHRPRRAALRPHAAAAIDTRVGLRDPWLESLGQAQAMRDCPNHWRHLMRPVEPRTSRGVLSIVLSATSLAIGRGHRPALHRPGISRHRTSVPSWICRTRSAIPVSASSWLAIKTVTPESAAARTSAST
jgi:hypothetical protein